MVLEDLEHALDKSYACAVKDMQKLENIKQLISQKQEVFNKRLEVAEEKEKKKSSIQQKLAFLKEKSELIEAKEEGTRQKMLSIQNKLIEMREKRESLGTKPRGFPVFRRSRLFDEKFVLNDVLDEGLESETISEEMIKAPFETTFEVLWNGLIEHEATNLVREGIKNGKEVSRGYWSVYFNSPEQVEETWKVGKPLPMKYEAFVQDMDLNQLEFSDLVRSYDMEQSVCVIMVVEMPNGIQACRWEILYLQGE